jgi:hypothetical protein
MAFNGASSFQLTFRLVTPVVLESISESSERDYLVVHTSFNLQTAKRKKFDPEVTETI